MERCSTRRWTPASSACPPSSCSSTSSTATSAARAPCPRRTPSGKRDARPARRSCAGAAGPCRPARTRATRTRSWCRRSARSVLGKRDALRTSLLSAADIKAIPFVIHLMRPMAKIVNRLGADFRWQHLPVPFEVYADGIDLVIFEEFGSGAAALHLQEAVARDELFRSEEYRRAFRKDYESKYGPRVWHRDFFDADIVECPDASIIGKSFGQVGVERGGLHPVDAFLDLVLEHGTAIRWRTTISNHRPAVLKKLAERPRHPDRLLRRRRAPAQHGVLQLRAAAAQARPRRRGRRQAVHVGRARRAPAHRRARRVVPHRRRHPARRRPRRPASSSTRPGSTTPSRSTTRRRSSSTAGCRGWSTATTPPSRPCSSPGAASSTDGEPTALLGHERTGQFLRAEQKSPAPAGDVRGASAPSLETPAIA